VRTASARTGPDPARLRQLAGAIASPEGPLYLDARQQTFDLKTAEAKP